MIPLDLMFELGLSEFQVIEISDGEDNLIPYCVLSVYEGPLRGSGVRIEKEGIEMGRDLGCGFSVIDDAQISNRHARITFANGKFMLKDLDSTNKYALVE